MANKLSVTLPPELEATRPFNAYTETWPRIAKAIEVLELAVMSSPLTHYQPGVGEFRYIYLSDARDMLYANGLMATSKPQRELGKILKYSELERVKLSGFHNKWIIRYRLW